MGKYGLLEEMEGWICWAAFRCRCSASRAVQRSHRAGALMVMMLMRMCTRQNAFHVSKWHEMRRTRQVRPACLLGARGVGVSYNKIRRGVMRV